MVCGATAATEKVQGIKRSDVDGISVYQIGAKYSNSMGFYRRIMAYGEFVRQATKVAKSIPADLVYATSTPLSVGIPGMKASKHHRIPFVFEVRDLWPELLVALKALRNPLCLLYTSPSPRDQRGSRMPSSA